MGGLTCTEPDETGFTCSCGRGTQIAVIPLEAAREFRAAQPHVEAVCDDQEWVVTVNYEDEPYTETFDGADIHLIECLPWP